VPRVSGTDRFRILGAARQPHSWRLPG
jgi:hypothetical protein